MVEMPPPAALATVPDRFHLRVAGRSNVVVMQTGFTGWQQDAAYQP